MEKTTIQHVCNSLGNVLLRCALIVLALSCIPFFRGLQSVQNIDAPVFVSLEHENAGRLVLEFDREVSVDSQGLIPHGGYTIDNTETEGNRLILDISDASSIGVEYLIEGRVYDSQENMLWFLLPFYGLNPKPARLILNEFINEHSSPNRLEKAEFYVQESGNLGGMSVYNGSASESRSSLVFQDQEVEAGEFIIVHFRSVEGSPEETGQINEYGSGAEALNRASSRNATEDVRDFWVEGEHGLSDTNGAISLYASPAHDAELLDAVVYSNRSFDSEEAYGSFGTAYMWRVVQAIYAAGGWHSENDIVHPEECIATEPSTSTRSINRNVLFSDTNTAADWHIVPSSMSSFGEHNSEEVHAP